MQLNFLLREMTHLRYFIPIVKEGNKRGLQSLFYVIPSYKYNCPEKHALVLNSVGQKHNIIFKKGQEITSASGIIFTSEESGIGLIKKNKKAKKVTMTYQTDFTASYKNYVDHVDHIMMPSEEVAKFYNLESEKNLYVGSPKYDITINKSKVMDLYGLPESKKVLIILPKQRDAHAVNLNPLCVAMKKMGYTLIFKARAKDSLSSEEQSMISKNGDFYFEDVSWYPHTTQQLLEVSDFVVNFGSTTIEECIMHNVPLINFDIKPKFRHGEKKKYRVTHEYLYNYKFCFDMKPDNLNEHSATETIKELLSSDLSEEFKSARQKYLHDHKNTCKTLLDMIL